MRVIAGQLGGRTLRAPRGTATRPTTDRVREALFSVLGDVSGARVLDLYAGSGALGIEALSRGAAHAVFVETSRAALAAIRANIAALDLDARTQVVATPVERAATAVAARAPFDLVLCDPPWPALDRALRALERLLAPGVLAVDARVVVEHPAGRAVDVSGGQVEEVDQRRWGDTAVTLFRAAPGSARGPGGAIPDAEIPGN